MIYWLTGQPGAGKTTLAKLLCSHLEKNQNTPVYHVDGDDIRNIFDNRDYSPEGRRKNIELAKNISHFLHTKNTSVVVSLVSPYRDQREELKSKLEGFVVEIYVHTTQTRGRENYHSPDYEKPLENFIDIDTTNISQEDSIKKILSLCQNNIQSS